MTGAPVIVAPDVSAGEEEDVMEAAAGNVGFNCPIEDDGCLGPEDLKERC